MKFPRPFRRQFLKTAALLIPATALAVRRLAAAPAPAPAAPQASPHFAFPLEPVAAAAGAITRRSEASLIELRDGTVFMAYASHAGGGDNARAPLVAKLLSAQGKPISEERVIVPPPEGGFNAMSPALQRLPDGRIGMLFSHRMSNRLASRRFIASADEGATWSTPVIVADGQYKTGCHDRFTVHSSGRLLAPCHCTDDREKRLLHVRVGRSDDLGATWQLGPAIELPKVHWAKPDGTGFIENVESGCYEPSAAERADGSVPMTMRTAMGTQFCSESFDRGETWSLPHSMEVISPTAPARLARIPGSSDLLLIWTSDIATTPRAGNVGRHTIMACVSSDGGKSWPHARRKLVARDLNRSIDYPSLLFKGREAWVTLRVSAGRGVLEGGTSTCLMRIPMAWFF